MWLRGRHGVEHVINVDNRALDLHHLKLIQLTDQRGAAPTAELMVRQVLKVQHRSVTVLCVNRGVCTTLVDDEC